MGKKELSLGAWLQFLEPQKLAQTVLTVSQRHGQFQSPLAALTL